jgi:hypothetical protein
VTDQPSDGRPPVSNDAVEHLWTAAHELLTAMRKLVDAADEFVADQMQGRARESEAQPHVQRIDIDVDTP